MQKQNSFLQFIKFCIVGFTNTLLSYGLYVGTLWIYKTCGAGFKYDYLVATAVSFVLSVFWSFCWNRAFVFKASKSAGFWFPLLKTYISYSFTGLFLSAFLNWFWIDIVGISKLFAPLINLCISVPLNFILNKFWAFKEKKVSIENTQEGENIEKPE